MRIPAGIVSRKNLCRSHGNYPGISPITRQENPTSPDLDGKSLGKSGNALEKKPRWKNICKAASMPMPTCSKKSHRLSRQSMRNAFASMAFCFQATLWKPQSGHPRRWPMNCLAFWMTRMLRRQRQMQVSHPIRSPSTISIEAVPRHGRTAALCVAVPASMEF